MFTGLIEEIGVVRAVEHLPEGSRLVVEAPQSVPGLKLGDSIAIDGACTTVVALDSTTFTIEASNETLSKTIMASYKAGTRVNLEQPLMPTSRLGGHYVTGHIDGLARLVSKTPDGLAWQMTFETENSELSIYLIPKGSVALSGISLTINTVKANQFSVCIIPHTLSHTNLSDFEPGDLLNVECDLLGKYVQKMLSQSGQIQLPQNTLSLV